MARRKRRPDTGARSERDVRDDRVDSERDVRDDRVDGVRDVRSVDDRDVRDDRYDDRDVRSVDDPDARDERYVHDERDVPGIDDRDVRDDRYVRDDRGPRTADVYEERDDRAVADRRRDAGVAAARAQFGGFDLPASLVGMLTALALLLLLAGIVSAAIGAVGYQVDVERTVEGNEQEISIGGLVGGVILLFIAFFVGGWAAGRIARYNGVLNGAMAAVWTLVLAAILSALGAWFGSEYDVFANVELPQWFSRDALTIGAIVSGVVAILAMLGGAALGGSRAERYHREADATVAAGTSPRVR